MGSSSSSPPEIFSPSIQISCQARLRGSRCVPIACASSAILACAPLSHGFRCRDDVAVHVAAGRDGVEHRVVHRLDRQTQIPLDDAVELDRLARGQAQCPVATFARDSFGRQPLLRCQDAARHAHPRHEDEGFFHLLATAFRAQVAIVLQVDAMELCQLLVIVRQCAGFHALQSLGDGTAQEAAIRLDRLVGRGPRGVSRHRADTSPRVAACRALPSRPCRSDRR